AASASAAPAAPPGPSPVDGVLPPSGAVPALALRHDALPGCGPLAVPADVLAKLPEAAPVAVWEEALGDRGCVAFAKDDGTDLALVSIDGKAEVALAEAPGSKVVLDRRWRGVRASGGGVTLRGVAGARVVVAIATRSGEPIGKRRPGKAWFKRPGRAAPIDLAEQRDLAWGKGAYHARIGWTSAPDDMPSLVVDALVFSKDAPVAEHQHDKQWECLVAFDGAGELVVKGSGGAADATTALAPGAVACIPAGRLHRWAPSGKAPLVALQVYAPPGPEQRFSKLAAP
ncbi:MAG TPA: hypothetical protein VHB21_00420, partial [Minicystis sp.]|nr:hypothetical protein [Minicystis sp.]